MKMHDNQHRGFTLIEVMVVVAIVGILAAIAYPSYIEHVRQTRRAEVTALMLENAQLLERHYTRHGAYDAGAVSGLVSQAPVTGTPVYNLSLVADSQSYSISATAQSGGMMAGDLCANYSLDQVGRRSPSDAKCWRR
ncbi:type IV pilus assembly protein PilE [Halopseudomonas xinjiangensis]|uniref:Type IV pilus assembly protein PilE n=1 Tax=Halopseudomonas xinjiangensis TaxID=487184 RepID=A0A1H1VXL9_9GAMM|nr:type IV pilin protein [Halopseudomonas xinjiangensis]SDS89617.1 type IV pilus assembly protein PilE [Halopseudomonas xinjiangensis]